MKNNWTRLYGEILKHGFKIRVINASEDGSFILKTYGIGHLTYYVLEPGKTISKNWRDAVKVMTRNKHD